jgi:hypothetical protein
MRKSKGMFDGHLPSEPIEQFLLTVDTGEIKAGTMVEVDGIAEGGDKYDDWYFVAPVGCERDPEGEPAVWEMVPPSYLISSNLMPIVNRNPGDETEES